MTIVKLKKGLGNPEESFRYLNCIFKTFLFKFRCTLFRKQVFWGKGLKIYGKLLIKGPGRVYLGEKVVVGMKVTPWTYDKKAEIIIGNNVFLNGTRFGCKKLIRIGDDCIIGECRIQDTNFHSLYINRHDPDAPIKVSPVIIEKNVWISPDSQILPGTHIGENSVIGINSVVNSDIPNSWLAAGNPAILLKKLMCYSKD